MKMHSRINLSRRLVRWLLALLVAVVMSAGAYVVNNLTAFSHDRVALYTTLHHLGLDRSRPTADEVLAVNVGYDKTLIEVNAPDGMPEGTIDVTDRSKLLAFLSALARRPDYRYVVLDVRFEQGYDTPADSALFALIATMPRIAVATQSDITPAPGLPAAKLALAEYLVTDYGTGFSRYRLTDGRQLYLPAKVHADITGHDIARSGLLYHDGGHLCHNSVFLTFPAAPGEATSGGTATFTRRDYLNLGADMLEVLSSDEIAAMARGRIVVVGDYIRDTHDTYAGEVAGPQIIATAIGELGLGRHLVSWPHAAAMLIVYLLVAYLTLSARQLIDFIPWLRRHRLLSFLASLIEYSVIFLLIDIAAFSIWGVVYSLYFPSVCFALLKQAVIFLRR